MLEAPPGAGKTTALPLELLATDPPWLQGKALVVVEPRRLATSAAARRMTSLLSHLRGEKLRLGRKGCPVGYAVRGDARCSFADARVVVVTPGVATRLLLEEFGRNGDDNETSSSPPVRRRRRRLFASPIGAVMLDEAHERSAEVDMLFALLAARSKSEPKSKSRSSGNPMRVIFASATLGGGLAEKAAAQLGETASIVRAPAAKSYPVAVTFAGPPRDVGGRGGRGGGGGNAAAASLAAAAATETVSLLGGAGGKHAKGDVLVFLPGVADIRATRAALEKLVDLIENEDEGGRNTSESSDSSSSSSAIEVLPLHGGLPPSQQDRVLSPVSERPKPRRRRIILSTPVAESSLTVPGVTSVVDAGLSRVPRLDPARGVEKLVTLPISKSSADQRAGRAGREAPGACVRLWSEGEHARRPAASAAEVSRGGSELAPLALSLVAADNDDDETNLPQLPWLDEPHRGDLVAGLELLQLLGLIRKKKKGKSSSSSSSSPHRAFELTPAGRQASTLGAHPRLSRMLLCSSSLKCPELGAVLSAVCSERDFILRDRRAREGAGASAASSASSVPAPSPGASAVERVLALAGRGPLVASVDRRGAAGVIDAAMVLERQLRAVVGDEEEEGEEEDEEEEQDEATSTSTLTPQRLRRRERRLSLAQAAADAVERGDPSLVGALIASAYPERVAIRRARGGRDRSAAFVLGGSGSERSSATTTTTAPATAVLPAGSQDPLLDCPFLAVATLGTSAAAARSSSLIFLAAPLEFKNGGEEGEGEGEGNNELLRSIPGLVVSGERSCAWIPSAARLVCSVRTRVGNTVVEERALGVDEISDEEAGQAFVEAAMRGGGLAALREPAASRAWRKLVAKIAAEEEEAFGDSSLLLASDLGADSASPAVLDTLLPALRKCRSAADLEALEWVKLLSSLLSPEQQARVVEEKEREGKETSSSSSLPPRAASAGSPAAGKAGSKKKGRPKR